MTNALLYIGDLAFGISAILKIENSKGNGSQIAVPGFRWNHQRRIACRPHLKVGFALSQITGDFVRLPSGRSLREATLKILEIGPFHNFLEKGWSEPSWIG